MSAILFLSDVILDPVIKEIKSLSGDKWQIDNLYEEDIVSKLLSIDESDVSRYDFIFSSILTSYIIRKNNPGKICIARES